MRPKCRDLILSAFTLATSPALGFRQLLILVSFQSPVTTRTVRRALDKLVAEGVVIEDVAPGLAAYSLKTRQQP